MPAVQTDYSERMPEVSRKQLWDYTEQKLEAIRTDARRMRQLRELLNDEDLIAQLKAEEQALARQRDFWRSVQKAL